MGQEPPQKRRTRGDHVSMRTLVKEYAKAESKKRKTTIKQISLVGLGSLAAAL